MMVVVKRDHTAISNTWNMFFGCCGGIETSVSAATDWSEGCCDDTQGHWIHECAMQPLLPQRHQSPPASCNVKFEVEVFGSMTKKGLAKCLKGIKLLGNLFQLQPTEVRARAFNRSTQVFFMQDHYDASGFNFGQADPQKSKSNV